jgi:SAM-dependent methyltransferase
MFIWSALFSGFMGKSLEFSYPGGELPLFAQARNWKFYIKFEVGEYLIGDVLEIGAGIGGTTIALNDGSARQWLCLEPDSNQAKHLQLFLARNSGLPPAVIVGSLAALAPKPMFDCILYIDVLEHIDDDRLQIQTAAQLVRPGGHIVVVSPAHQWLFSEFDKTIGHLRRYDKQSLRKLMPSGWKEIKLKYLDSLGVFVSLANVIALRQSLPTLSQIELWDRICVPLSRAVDRVSLGTFGKSVLAVWQNPAHC